MTMEWNETYLKLWEKKKKTKATKRKTFRMKLLAISFGGV